MSLQAEGSAFIDHAKSPAPGSPSSEDLGKGEEKGKGERKKTVGSVKNKSAQKRSVTGTLKSPAPGSPSSEDGGKGEGKGKGERKKPAGSVKNKSAQKRPVTGRTPKAKAHCHKPKETSKFPTPRSPSSDDGGKGKEKGKHNTTEPDEGGGAQ